MTTTILPKVTQTMLSCVVPNPILYDSEGITSYIKDASDVKTLAPFCLYNPRKIVDHSVEHYIAIPIKISKGLGIAIGDIGVFKHADELVNKASGCDIVAVIKNGPRSMDKNTVSIVAKWALSLKEHDRFLLHNGVFYTYRSFLAYLGSSVIKQSYFWLSHKMCLLKKLNYYRYMENGVNRSLLTGSSKENVYDYSMNHELSFGSGGTAVKDSLKLSDASYEHLLGMLYSQCSSIDSHYSNQVKRLSLNYEDHPFRVAVFGHNIVITRLHTFEHYMYEQYAQLIQAYEDGNVHIKDTPDGENVLI